MSQEDFQHAARLRDEAAALREQLPPVAQYVLAQLQELQAASSTQRQTEIISALGGTLLNPTGNHRQLGVQPCVPAPVGRPACTLPTSCSWPGTASKALRMPGLQQALRGV